MGEMLEQLSQPALLFLQEFLLALLHPDSNLRCPLCRSHELVDDDDPDDDELAISLIFKGILVSQIRLVRLLSKH